jgi:alpha-1,2-mannosyltransferase
MNAARAFARPKVLIGIGLVLVNLGVVAAAMIDVENGFYYHLDLDVYRIGAQAWINGEDLYGVLPPTAVGMALPFTYPPISAVLFSPMTIMPLALSGALLTVLGAGLSGLVIAACVDRSRWLVAGAVLPVALLMEPVRETLSYGQINILLMALVLADCLTKKPRWPRGALVGLAAAIKLTPAAFVLFFLIRRDYRSTLTAVVSFLAATAVGFAVSFDNSVRYWSTVLFDTDRIGHPQFAGNQSLLAVLVRFGLQSPGRSAVWLIGAGVVVVVAVIAIRRASTAGRPMFALCLNALAILVISPVSWSHHWVWVVPLLMVCHSGWLRVGGLAIFLAAPHWWWYPRTANREYEWNVAQQLLGNAYFYFAVLVLIWAAFGSVVTRRAMRVMSSSRRVDKGRPEPFAAFANAGSPGRHQAIISRWPAALATVARWRIMAVPTPRPCHSSSTSSEISASSGLVVRMS